MQSTEREVPKTFVAALNHLGATFILMFSMTLELIVLVVIRIGNRIEGKSGTPANTTTKAYPSAASPRRKPKAAKVVSTTVADEEFERAMAAATAVRTQSPQTPLVNQMAMGVSPPQREAPVKCVDAPMVDSTAPPRSAVKTPVKTTEPNAAAVPIELVDKKIYVGTITWAGFKSYPNNGRPYNCFTAHIATKSGDMEMLQATSLKQAFNSAHVNLGDRVTIEIGKEPIGIIDGKPRHRNNCVVTKHNN